LGPKNLNLWIDGHCHLNWGLKDPEQAVHRAEQARVGRFVFGGVEPREWVTQVEWKRKDPDRYFPVFGMHPVALAEVRFQPSEAFDLLKQQMVHFRPVALGEVGLDARRSYWSEEQKKIQFEWMKIQLELAVSENLPVVLHIVRAHEEALNLLQTYRGRLSGIVHSFGGDAQQGKRYRDLGLGLSLSAGGIHQGEVRPKIREAQMRLGPEAFTYETDSPDQRLEDFGQFQNEPAQLIEIARIYAQTWGLSKESLLAHSTDLLSRTFRLPM
jgi:TatD DNase family protein